MALPSGDVRDAGTAPQAQTGGILALLPLQPWVLPGHQPCCPWLPVNEASASEAELKGFERKLMGFIKLFPE